MAKQTSLRFTGRKVSEILRQKKGGIKQAQLPEGSPSWDDFGRLTSEEVEAGARANKPGFKLVRKLLTDRRFDR